MSELTEGRIIELSWIEFQPRPKKDGLHDSGYRFIRLIGVDADGTRHDLGEWHDHLVIESGCNIDVTPDGVIRIMPWKGAGTFRVRESRRVWWTSTAWVDGNGMFT